MLPQEAEEKRGKEPADRDILRGGRNSRSALALSCASLERLVSHPPGARLYSVEAPGSNTLFAWRQFGQLRVANVLPKI